MKFAIAVPSLSMNGHPPAMRSSWRVYIYIYIYIYVYIYISYSFRLFFSGKQVSEVREPPPWTPLRMVDGVLT